MCSDQECHDNAAWIGELGMKADMDGDMSIDHDECGALDDEFEGFVCHTLIDHCDLDGDG
jgi:hypothetical protein